MSGVLGWRAAMGRALYAPGGFYVAGGGPAAHFATSAQHPLLAEVVLALARRAGTRRVVDLGAGRGELVTGLHALDPTLSVAAVEVAPRPREVPCAVSWHGRLAELPLGKANATLLIAHEWLDTVPVDVVQQTEAGWLLVVVDPRTGAETLAAPPPSADLAWLERWWPLGEPGDRAEVGRSRDIAWQRVLRRLPGALLLAVDYGTTRGERAARAYAGGTLRAHQQGRLVPVIPDGSRDVTAAVAMDAVRAAGEQAGAVTMADTSQRDALAELLPAPRTYVQSLAQRELRDPEGLGAFRWLLQRATRRTGARVSGR